MKGLKTGKAKVTITLASGKKQYITVTVQKTTVKTTKISGLKSEKTGKTYDAIISFSDKEWTDKKGSLHVGFSMEFEKPKSGKKKGG